MKKAITSPVIVRAKSALILMAVVSLLGVIQATPATVAGSWTIEITFNSGPIRLLRFEAQDSGKGSFLLLDPSLKVWGPAKPTQAKWSQADDGSVSFSGPMEFPLGNVGRDAGTLLLKGKFEGDGIIVGTVTFTAIDQNPDGSGARPSKAGRFKATRSAGADNR
jgi:hypothetical protein